ncbi:MAG: molybdopterin cofactor-binding domain-containing protein, partial [Candidatus Neomarinimicrobiota bacterium]
MPEISLRINDQECRVSVDTNETLLDTLRDRLHLTGAKRGCDSGDCGACTILLDGQPVNACLVLSVEAAGQSVLTIEGIDDPIQDKFVEHGSFQCGFCAPGIVVSSKSLLVKNPNPDDGEIKKTLAGHLCRCTGYVRILSALKGENTNLDPDQEFAVVGKPVTRKDIRDKVRGKAQFTADLYFPNMIYGALVTSSQAYARIVKIDPSQALVSEGVKLVLTPEDVPTTPYGVSPARYDETILPQGIVRHLGEPIAAVFASDRRYAEMAAEKVKIEYESLNGVFNPEAAIKKTAPQLHAKYKNNINTDIHQNFGNIDKVFSKADYIREDVFQGQRTHQAYLEPATALAMEEGDLINVWTSNQNPHLVQVQLARVLGIAKSQLRVMTPAIGGGFGGKAETTKLEFLSVIASRKLKRPVLMSMDREQAFQHGRGRHAQTIKFKSAFNKEGKLLGTHQQVTLDGGAYTSYGIITAYYSGSLLPILYKMSDFRFDAQRIYTNLPTCGAMRGNGTPQPRFAFESHLDLAARDLGLSPVDIRGINLVEPDYQTINELQITSCKLKECLEKAVELTGFNKKYSHLPFGKGIGISLGSFVSGAGYPIIRGDYPQSACTIRVGEDGEKVFIYAGTS